MRRFRPISLVSWLGWGSILIVGIAVMAVTLRSVDLLQEFAEREGLAQAQLAVASAHGFVDRAHRSAADSARLLGRLSGLHEILQAAQPDGLVAYLRNFCAETSGVDGCAVSDGNRIVGVSDPALPWDAALAVMADDRRRFVIARDADHGIWLGAAARVRGLDERLRTITLKRIEESALVAVTEQSRATIRFSQRPQSADAWANLHTRAATARRPVAERLTMPGVIYAASMPIQLASDEITTFIDVGIEARSMDALVTDLIARLGVTTLGVISVAGLAGVLYGRWLVRPVARLGRAASRIGRGDLTTSVPVAGVPEVATLGTDMENMRRSLVGLTSELHQREAQANAVLTGIVEGVYAVDMERRIRYANPQVAAVLGRAPGAIIGRFCGDVLDPEPVNGQRPCERSCPILAARASDTGTGTAVEKIRGPRGDLRSIVVVSAMPADGQQVQVLRDETELEAARRARDSVLANISHEFRTPLAAQLASIELLHDRLETMSRGEREQLIHNIQRGWLRLMQLIDNLLESVRIDAGQLAIRHQSVSLADVITEATSLMKPLLDQRRQRVVLELPPELPAIVGDEIRLMQVFVNLLANAIKFAPEASTVHVGAAAAGDALTAWVEDEGPGIADDDRPAVFQPFQRSFGSEPGAPGLGLGLWIVKSIIERHHGTVSLRRTAAGRTRCSIRLPLEATT